MECEGIVVEILICDNDALFAETLGEQVRRVFSGECGVRCCAGAGELEALCAGEAPDIVLMDIQLDGQNGIDLAQKHFPKERGTAVIFVTGYLEYVTDVYEADHVYFLPKPVQEEKLRRALDKAMAACDDAPCAFSVRVNGKLQRIDLRDVYCIESFYRKLRVRMAGEAVECYGSISELPRAVLTRMIHCHKSFLVNPEHVRTMDRKSFLLKNGTVIPISRTRYSASREKFLAHCGRHLEGSGRAL